MTDSAPTASPADPPVAVVTGGSGFVGAAVCRALRRRGWRVRALDLRPAPGVTVADLADDGDWTGALSGARLLVHAAARVGERGDVAGFWRHNVDATRTLLAAAERTGVRRVVHVSSIVVYGLRFPPGADESWSVQPTGNPYTDSKVAAEHLALLAAAGGRVPVTVVRPGDVYGPGSAQWTVRPVELLRRGRFALPGGGDGVLSPVFIDDLVSGLLAVAEHPQAVGEVFNLHGGHAVTARRFFDYYAKALGVPIRSVPAVVLRATGPVAELARRLGVEPPFSARTVEYLTHPGSYSTAKISRVTGWAPRVDLAEGMALTLRWLREQGLLPAAAEPAQPGGGPVDLATGRGPLVLPDAAAAEGALTVPSAAGRAAPPAENEER